MPRTTDIAAPRTRRESRGDCAACVTGAGCPGDRVAVGSTTLEHFAQTAKKTEHAPRGRDTSRNSLVPLGASESPRSALSPAVSVPRYHVPTTGRGKRIFGTKSGPRQPQTTGLVSSRYLGFGVSQIPRRHRQLAFPPIPTGTPSRLTALAHSVPCFDLFGRLGPVPNVTSNPRTGQPAGPAHMPIDLCFRGDRKSDKVAGAGSPGNPSCAPYGLAASPLRGCERPSPRVRYIVRKSMMSAQS